MEQRILPKNIFLAHFEIVQNFHHFCKVRGCGFSVNNSIFKNSLKVCRNTSFWWVEQRILQKNIFLAHFEIVQNFHNFFVRSAAVDFLSNIKFSKNSLKVCRNTSFDAWIKRILPKNIFLAHFEIVQNFHHFCKVRGCGFSVKNSIFQKHP